MKGTDTDTRFGIGLENKVIKIEFIFFCKVTISIYHAHMVILGVSE